VPSFNILWDAHTTVHEQRTECVCYYSQPRKKGWRMLSDHENWDRASAATPLAAHALIEDFIAAFPEAADYTFRIEECVRTVMIVAKKPVDNLADWR
jgi:hypothetical protein